MNLSDDEIREIIRQRKRRTRRRRWFRRRLIRLGSILLIAVIAVIVLAHIPLIRNKGVIFIDAGHGGEDPGAQALGRSEKDDTLRLALQVRKDLARKGFTVYMSRTDDETVDRPHRAEMANEKKAKLFVSIHRNKADDANAQGVEAWIHSAGNSSAKLLAENILRQLEDEGFTYRKVGTGTLADPSDNYSENRYTEMPSCIIETGFISNKEDNARFDDNLKKNAQAFADGIEETYAALYEKDDDK